MIVSWNSLHLFSGFSMNMRLYEIEATVVAFVPLVLQSFHSMCNLDIAFCFSPMEFGHMQLSITL